MPIPFSSSVVDDSGLAKYINVLDAICVID